MGGKIIQLRLRVAAYRNILNKVDDGEFRTYLDKMSQDVQEKILDLALAGHYADMMELYESSLPLNAKKLITLKNEARRLGMYGYARATRTELVHFIRLKGPQ